MDRSDRPKGWRVFKVFWLSLLDIVWPAAEQVRPRDAKDVMGYLQDQMNGTGGPDDWTDFITQPISDRRLDAIRASAAEIAVGFDGGEKRKLRDLIERTRALAAIRNATAE